MTQKAKPVLLGFSCPLSKTGSNQQNQDTSKLKKRQWDKAFEMFLVGVAACSYILSITMLLFAGARL